MNQAIVDIGDAVRITSGPYKGMEGEVEDRQPDCDVVRVGTSEGAAYCFIVDAVRLSVPRLSSKAILKKR